MKRAHFSPALFTFLKELRRHNNREWFLANKGRYESDVREPLLRFIGDFAPHLHRISPHFVADARPVGGSMFRIYRDTRFARDKSPYKTVAAVQFRHEQGGDVHTPGFYLHLEPGNVFGGAGLWHPDSGSLRRVREAIVEHPEKWKRATSGRSFGRDYRLTGESLKRPPRGFDPEHPLIGDLRRKDFVATTSFTEEDACSPAFLTTYAKRAKFATEFMEFLTRAIDLRW